MKSKIVLIAMLSLFNLTAIAKEKTEVLDFFQATLHKKTLNTKMLTIGDDLKSASIVTIAGETSPPKKSGRYAYRPNIKKSLYSSKYDAGKSLNFDQLKEGEVYYFTLLSKDDGKTFKTITFVSKERPAE